VTSLQDKIFDPIVFFFRCLEDKLVGGNDMHAGPSGRAV